MEGRRSLTQILTAAEAGKLDDSLVGKKKDWSTCYNDDVFQYIRNRLEWKPLCPVPQEHLLRFSNNLKQKGRGETGRMTAAAAHQRNIEA